MESEIESFIIRMTGVDDEGKDEVILGDTAAKLLQKVHQLYSGTVKFESGRSMVIDTSKAEFIKEQFAGNKIGIFYVFKADAPDSTRWVIMPMTKE